jgi:hypothetical protein
VQTHGRTSNGSSDCLFIFSEAIKEGGKTLTKGAVDTFAQLVKTIGKSLEQREQKGC